MSTDVKQLSRVELTSEQIEWHMMHARQLRNEALARGVRWLITSRHRKRGVATHAGAQCLVPCAGKR